jgi:hypothetical protein
MPKLLDRAVRLTLALLIAGGLGIGARSASAGAIPPDCSHQVPYQSCTTASQCDAPCQAYFGSGATGVCNRSCCMCALLPD